MSDVDLRDAYMRWFRRAMPCLLLPLLLTALLQLAMASQWWELQVPGGAAARYLFYSVGVAAAVVGRDTRRRETADRPLAPADLASLSWRLLVYALAPSATGVVLAFMTRQAWDYYVLLGATLVALVLLFPRYEQWVEWSAHPGRQSDAASDA